MPLLLEQYASKKPRSPSIMLNNALSETIGIATMVARKQCTHEVQFIVCTLLQCKEWINPGKKAKLRC
jgi:hypothetical protein